MVLEGFSATLYLMSDSIDTNIWNPEQDLSLDQFMASTAFYHQPSKLFRTMAIPGLHDSVKPCVSSHERSVWIMRSTICEIFCNRIYILKLNIGKLSLI